MDSLQDFFKEFKNRIANPIFFSFIIAWLLWNWKVTVGFLMYNQDTLKNYGYFNYSYLITENASWENYFYHPLCSALFYTILFPPIRVGIIAFLSWMDRINTWSKKKIMKNATVPMRRFMKETERTDGLSKKLEDLYTKDSAIKDENDDLKSKLNDEMNISAQQSTQLRNFTEEVLSLNNNIGDLKNKLLLSEERIQLYSKQFDQTLINGVWEIVYKCKEEPSLRNFSGETISERIVVSIKDGKFYNKIPSGSEFIWAYILAFNYSYFEKTVNLTLRISEDKYIQYDEGKSRIYFQTLTILHHLEDGHIGKMTGIDSDLCDVSYTMLVN
ncbi:hypothetical protein F0919_05050 [Taibaiella lutea]|uniref:Uncharacterized protein n=1 Tax=Taibaiella lutea TaxID=2608001 RepID=A0A5M6CQ10_9BACT|nr:hypothetical protein [Taibaiella lutea]KAA5537043.1 hypothetical protein F0919_05050 [Taibaiella lutea]